MQPDRREDEEKFDEDRAKRQDTADQDAKERVHVPEVEDSKEEKFGAIIQIVEQRGVLACAYAYVVMLMYMQRSSRSSALSNSEAYQGRSGTRRGMRLVFVG